MCNTFAIYFQIFVTFGYKKVKNSDNHKCFYEIQKFISNSVARIFVKDSQLTYKDSRVLPPSLIIRYIPV